MSGRNFSRLALVFLVLFAVLIAGVLFPFQPLDPAWQSRLTAGLVNAATLPLLALALLELARLLEPDDPVIRGRQRRCAQLAIAASLGFLLLAPLQISAGLRLQNSSGSQALSRLSRAEATLATLREALAEADTKADLHKRFQVLNGPTLSPADLDLPLPVLKAQAAAVFDQAQARITREKATLPAMNPLWLLPEQLRNTSACLALALGFAIFARRPGDQLSLLEAINARLDRLKLLSAGRGRRKLSSEAEFIHQMCNNNEHSQ